MATPRMLVALSLSAVIVAIVFGIAAAVGEWWILPVALVVHAAGFSLVMAVLVPRLRDTDKPDPVTEARLEEEAVEEQKRDGSGRRSDGPRRRRESGDEERVFGH